MLWPAAPLRKCAKADAADLEHRHYNIEDDDNADDDEGAEEDEAEEEETLQTSDDGLAVDERPAYAAAADKSPPACDGADPAAAEPAAAEPAATVAAEQAAAEDSRLFEEEALGLLSPEDTAEFADLLSLA